MNAQKALGYEAEECLRRAGQCAEKRNWAGAYSYISELESMGTLCTIAQTRKVYVCTHMAELCLEVFREAPDEELLSDFTKAVDEAGLTFKHFGVTKEELKTLLSSTKNTLERFI